MATENDVSFVFDRDVSSYTVDAIHSCYDTTWFYITLHGLRVSFNRILKLSTPIEFCYTDRLKELLEKRMAQDLQYPYAYITFNEMDLIKDQASTGAMARTGLKNKRLIGDSVPVSFLFPTKLSITLNIIDSDINRLLSISQAILLADVSRSFNFKLNADKAQSIIKVSRNGSISYPENGINTDTETDYASGKISIPFEIQTQIGFTSLFPAIKVVNITVYSEDPSGTSADTDEHVNLHKEMTYKFTVNEGEDGKNYIDKLFTSYK